MFTDFFLLWVTSSLSLCVEFRYGRSYDTVSSKGLGNSANDMQQYVFFYRYEKGERRCSVCKCWGPTGFNQGSGITCHFNSVWFCWSGDGFLDVCNDNKCLICRRFFYECVPVQSTVWCRPLQTGKSRWKWPGTFSTTVISSSWGIRLLLSSKATKLVSGQKHDTFHQEDLEKGGFHALTLTFLLLTHRNQGFYSGSPAQWSQQSRRRAQQTVWCLCASQQ